MAEMTLFTKEVMLKTIEEKMLEENTCQGMYAMTNGKRCALGYIAEAFGFEFPEREDVKGIPGTNNAMRIAHVLGETGLSIQNRDKITGANDSTFSFNERKKAILDYIGTFLND